jgi:hypothetical protein
MDRLMRQDDGTGLNGAGLSFDLASSVPEGLGKLAGGDNHRIPMPKDIQPRQGRRKWVHHQWFPTASVAPAGAWLMMDRFPVACATG